MLSLVFAFLCIYILVGEGGKQDEPCIRIPQYLSQAPSKIQCLYLPPGNTGGRGSVENAKQEIEE